MTLFAFPFFQGFLFQLEGWYYPLDALSIKANPASSNDKKKSFNIYDVITTS